jgi:hypothetical protein
MIELKRAAVINDILNNQRDIRILNLYNNGFEVSEIDQSFNVLSDENCDDFYAYIEWMGLAKGSDLIVLPSTHHYYYNIDDLKNVKTVVNLKQLNKINQLKGFLHTFFHAMPPQSNFIGCFVDSDKKPEINSTSKIDLSGRIDPFDNGIASRNQLVNIIYNLLDLKIYRSLNKRSVRLLLEDHGFKLTDMTELNGITYFCTRRAQLSA